VHRHVANILVFPAVVLAAAARAVGDARRTAVVTCSALAAALALAAPASADWNQYRGDAARSGSAPWSAASPPAGVLDWRRELGAGAMIDASPVVNPNTGVIYLGTTGKSSLKRGARLFAFYPNGALRWAVPLDGYDVRAAPAVRRDGFPVVVGEQARPVSVRRYNYYYWKLSERVFLLDQFTGAVRAVRSEPDGCYWFTSNSCPERQLYGMAPVVDESRNETYVRAPDGLWRLDPSLRFLDDVMAATGVTGEGLGWDDIGKFLCPFCVAFDPSGLAAEPPLSEPLRFPRLPSPAFSPTCDDFVWSLPQTARARAVARGSKAFGYLEASTPVATPALGKAGRMYAPVLDHGQVYLEAYDQFAQTPAWRAGPLGDGTVSPPALGRVSGEGASTTAVCTRVHDQQATTVRDHRPESVYVASGPTLYAFDDRGRLRWKHNPGGKQLGEPVVARLKNGDELVLITWTDPNSHANFLVAYQGDGRVAWRLALDAPALGSPAIANGRIYVATTRSLYAIR
jgi:outer membrane protein assembly factor BamB